VRYYGKNRNELQLPFNFRLMEQPWSADTMRRSVDELEAALPDLAWPNYVLGNHDQPRLASRVGGQAQARLAAMMLLTLRGTPTLYYGDELGIENGHIPAEKIQDPQGKNLGPERTRDVTRTPMLWDGTPFAGFSTVEPWLPVSGDFASRNVEAQSREPASMLNLYRRLLRFRRETPALYGGRYTPLETGTPDCYVYLREDGNDRRFIALNFSAEARQVNIPIGTDGEILLSTHMDRQGPVSLNNLKLRSFEGVVIRPRKLL
jgi:alpha-glucosidase